MASRKEEEQRKGALVKHGPEECYTRCMELLAEIGFPKGVLPLHDLEECGRVDETGFVWMKQKTHYDHYFKVSENLVRYEREVTAYVEKGKMKKVTGVKSKQLMLWVPIVEMSIEEPAGDKIYFKTQLGLGKSFPILGYMDEEEKQKYMEKRKNEKAAS